MKIIRAEYLGMCFGVRDAIALVRHEAAARPVTVLGELVHNETVLDDLRERGVRFENQPENVFTDTAMITAHGASNRAKTRARNAGLTLSDATCPLVYFAHESMRELVKDGCHPVIIGQRGHVEVRGLTEDLDDFDVVLNESDVLALSEHKRFGVVAQTTQPIARVHTLVASLRHRFPESAVRLVDTVCRPTKQRQEAAVELARLSDVVLVIGGANSNNTAELARTCRHTCARVHHVQGPADIDSDWLSHASTIGVTAGTSTPDELIDAVEARLWEIIRGIELETVAA
jgi:4-hydroxy-3-methylbut-2-enyl diphosphate reductase